MPQAFVTSNGVYISTRSIDAAAQKIAALEPCPFAGRITEDQIKIALAEADIWPLSILLDAVLNGHA